MSRHICNMQLTRLIANYSLHINTVGLTNYVSEQSPPSPTLLVTVCQLTSQCLDTAQHQYSELFMDELFLCHPLLLLIKLHVTYLSEF